MTEPSDWTPCACDVGDEIDCEIHEEEGRKREVTAMVNLFMSYDNSFLRRVIPDEVKKELQEKFQWLLKSCSRCGKDVRGRIVWTEDPLVCLDCYAADAVIPDGDWTDEE